MSRNLYEEVQRQSYLAVFMLRAEKCIETLKYAKVEGLQQDQLVDAAHFLGKTMMLVELSARGHTTVSARGVMEHVEKCTPLLNAIEKVSVRLSTNGEEKTT